MVYCLGLSLKQCAESLCRFREAEYRRPPLLVQRLPCLTSEQQKKRRLSCLSLPPPDSPGPVLHGWGRSSIDILVKRLETSTRNPLLVISCSNDLTSRHTLHSCASLPDLSQPLDCALTCWCFLHFLWSVLALSQKDI